MSSVYLKTERIVLKEVVSQDASAFFMLDSDPDVMTYISGGAPSSPEDCKGAVERCLNQYKRYDRKFGLWWAYSKESEKRLGWFLLRPDKLNPESVHNPELGYRFSKDNWGKGYATEGSKALVDKAFKDLECESVYAVAMTDNIASQNVMKKSGMKFIGDYQQDECFAPGANTKAVHYKITKKEWENAKNN